jgi:hypothetical protein
MTINEKATRKMGPKGFLHKAEKANGGKISANGFLTAHKEWLSTGEIGDITQPILDKWETGAVMATPALQEIKKLVLDYHLATEAEKLASKGTGGRTAKVKPYTATIYNARGEIQTAKNAEDENVDLVKSFDLIQEANRWADRRLFDGAPDWFGTVVSNLQTDSDGQNLSWTVLRDEAIGRILATKPGAVCKKPPKSTGRLSPQMKVSQSHCRFSKG